MRQIAMYGKAGIGKSITLCNVTMALGEKGKTVMQVGCNPKHDSTKLLLDGRYIPTVLDVAREVGVKNVTVEMIRFQKPGNDNIHCVESGGPEPGVGCAGRGVLTAIQTLERLKVYKMGIDYVLYDVIGDVVCGGFALPIREGYAQEIYLVVSGELMALYAANNIAKAVKKFGLRGTTRLAGIICVERNVDNEEELGKEFANAIGSKLVAFIPRDKIVQEAELKKKSVIEFAPDSEQAAHYRSLTNKLIENKDFSIPEPISMDKLTNILFEYGAMD